MVTKKKRIGLFIGIMLIYFSLFYGSYLWFNIYSMFFSKQEIAAISAAISLNETEQLMIINKIADWLKSNIKWHTSRFQFFPFYWRKVKPSANWIVSVKRGACEENAVLFVELARNARIESRVVYNPGEDHVWNEVWINGSWTHFDATLSEENRFDNPGFYERSRDHGGWGKELSYVYSIDSKGRTHNVTSRYTKTGILVVDVKKDGSQIENANVIVQSRFLMETKPESYKQPLLAIERYTGKNGRCVFELGENNYTIIAQRGDERAESNVTVLENTSTTTSLHLAKSSAPLSLPSILPLILATSVIVVLASLLTYYFVLRVLRFALKNKNVSHLKNYLRAHVSLHNCCRCIQV